MLAGLRAGCIEQWQYLRELKGINAALVWLVASGTTRTIIFKQIWLELESASSSEVFMKKTLLILVSTICISLSVFSFEGRISATLTSGGQAQALLYTVATNALRIERSETKRPHAWNIIELNSEEVTLVFPHNRSFVRLKAPSTDPKPEAPTMPMPPRSGPAMSGLQAGGTPAMPAPIGALPGGMPMLPLPEMQPLELTATKQTTNLLGYLCTRYELKQHGETMEIWATDKLLPFRMWRQNQPPRSTPDMIEERWPELLQARKLFPLLVTLHDENNIERLRFEVTAASAETIKGDYEKLFQPPVDYNEMEPLPPFNQNQKPQTN
jgi:Domain of unknown function (DUF4412)